MKTMNISYLKKGAPSPYSGKPQKPGEEVTGTKLTIMSLESVLEMCKNLPESGQKRMDGAIFPVVKETLGANNSTYDEVKYDGILFVDLDHISKNMADVIFDNFDELSVKYPFFYAIQRSSSYYLRPESNDVGLHLFLYGPEGDGNDYARFARFALAVTAEILDKELGINLVKYESQLIAKGSTDKVLDTHNCKIGQRFYLYHSNYKINQNCFPMSENMYNLNIMKLREKYPWCYIEHSEVISTFENPYGLYGKVENKIQLDYSAECVISNFLAKNGWSVEKIAATLYAIDSRDDKEYAKKHGFTKISHFNQIARTSMKMGLYDSQKERAIYLLKQCGITVQEEKPKIFEVKPVKVFKLNRD